MAQIIYVVMAHAYDAEPEEIYIEDAFFNYAIAHKIKEEYQKRDDNSGINTKYFIRELKVRSVKEGKELVKYFTSKN